jgi:protein-disulfide isomerase
MDEITPTSFDSEISIQPLDSDQESTQLDFDTLKFKRSHLYAALLPLTFVVGLAVGYLFWGRDTPTPTAAVPQAVPVPAAEVSGESEPTAPQDVTRYEVSEDDDPVLGPDTAPITIIEFSDYECPYCRKWHVEVWPQLQAEYPDQIRLVFRDFPLTSIHANAIPAAAAANCAREQEQYWEFNELLFSNRYSLSKSSYQLYAEELGLDMTAFNECLDSGRYNDEVQADFDFAAGLGVRSTPTFFVNGIPVVGAQPFEVFADLIEKELAGEIP